MKIALIGATGMIGQRILAEALSRGHDVTAIARNTNSLTPSDHVKVVAGDVLDVAAMAAAVRGHDAVVDAASPPQDDPDFLVRAPQALVAALKQAGVSRLIIVGGAGSLEVAPGLRLYDTPEFPEAWRPSARAHGAALDELRGVDLDWTFISPAAMIMPGERTGKFRVGGDQLMTDDKGESNISAEDYAVALLNELEQPKYVRRRMSVAY